MDVETIWENSMKHLQSDSSGGKKKKSKSSHKTTNH